MAKLSSRERKAQKAGGTLNYKTGKISVKKAQPRSLVSKNRVKPDSNYMDTESYTENIYKALPANSPAKISAASSAGDKARAIARKNTNNKAKVAKAQKMNTGLSGGAGLTFGGSGAGTALNTDQFNENVYTGGLTRRGNVGAGQMTKTGRFMQILNDPLGTGKKPLSEQFKDKIGLSGVDVSSLIGLDKYLRTPVAQASYNPNGVENMNLLQLGGESLGLPKTQVDNDPFDEGDGTGLSGANPNIFKTPATNDNTRNYPKPKNNDDSNQIDTESYTNDIFNALSKNPYQEDPANVKLADNPFGTQRPASGRGSGLFGTGKGVGNPAGPEDEYIRELRKSLKGYGSQEDDVMRQFKNLIKALDPTYDEYEKEAKDELGRALWNNNTQLASVMNANNVGDSEQRAQLLAGQQRDNQSQLGDLLRKLMLQKNEDIQGYKTKGVEAVNSIRDKEMSARERIAQLIRQAQVDNMAQTQSAGRGRSALAATGSGRDVAFEKEAKKLQQQILMGRINRDAAAKSLSSAFPDYDENVIYDLVPDNYNR